MIDFNEMKDKEEFKEKFEESPSVGSGQKCKQMKNSSKKKQILQEINKAAK